MKLLELYNEALENPVTFTTFDDDGRITISAMVGRTNVGYIVVEQIVNGYWMFEDDITEEEYDEIFPDDSFLKIEHLLVFDDYKNGGYGKQLVNQALKYAKEVGENIIYLNASPMGGSGLSIGNLVNFYKSFGFKILPHSEKWSNNKEMVLNVSRTINESETDSVGCISDFGKELFGAELGGNEKNTRLEDEYAQLIKQFGDSDFGVTVNSKLVSAMHNLKKCASTYPEVLIPDSETLYRGSNLPLGFFLKNGLKMTSEGIDYIYNPKSPIQSWTANESVAEQFTGVFDIDINRIGKSFINYHLKGLKAEDKFFLEVLTKKEFLKIPIPVIYVSKSNKEDFLFKHKYFNVLTGENEDEVIRVSSDPINVKLVVKPTMFDVYTKKFINAYNDIIEFGLDNGDPYRPNLSESIDKKITCKNCGWSWKESESKIEDLYLCHKCGYNNEPR